MYKKGFTLIELLVVIAIIALLASIVVSSLTNARQRARDTRRIADLSQIKTALEMYYNENGFYPPSPCGYDCNGYAVSFNGTWDALQIELSPYIEKMPIDPINSPCEPWASNCYSYSYGNVGLVSRHEYDLTAKLEDSLSPYRCELKNYTFYFGYYSWCSYSNLMYEASTQ